MTEVIETESYFIKDNLCTKIIGTLLLTNCSFSLLFVLCFFFSALKIVEMPSVRQVTQNSSN